MSETKSDLLQEHEWAGTFFPPGLKELSFGGRLIYSPTGGLRLEYARDQAVDRNQTWDYLQGHTSTGMPLTLVGEFNSTNSGLRGFHGMGYLTSSGHPFRYVIFGAHLDDKTTFEEYTFNISGAEEFFVPAGHKSAVKFRRDPVFRAQTDVGEISAIMMASFHAISNDITKDLYEENEEALGELQAAYDAVKAKHPSFIPMLRKSLDYKFSLKTERKIGAIDAFEICGSIADLFSVLFYGPAILSEFTAIAKDQHGYFQMLEILPSNLMGRGSLEQAARERSFFHLPLNSNDIDIATIIPAWLRENERFSTIVSTLQGSTGLVSKHEVFSSIVLSVAQLESMAKEASCYGNKEKFQYGIDQHASEKVRKAIIRLLGCEPERLGGEISNLRNEIAHMKKPRKHLKALGFDELYMVSFALEVTVAGYALDQIGVSRAAREEYQDKLMRWIKVAH